MRTDTPEQVVREYLDRLERELADLPRPCRRDQERCCGVGPIGVEIER